ncbi:MAG: AarF/ABC1/UbiB kinase family protein [Candidatus Adiutrix sp.]|jgi:ubiquinone biosynthesis protein|nr:AarF/ABC1/UbiB kinase family protein [Candidatus Adiutrix sp.]
MKQADGNSNGAIAGLSKLNRLYRHMGRATEVGAVLVKFGFDDLLVRLGLTDLLDHVRGLVGLKVQDRQLSRPELVRLVIEELGVVFIKWGQYLSTRDDLMPEAYIKEFSRLQNSVQPMPFEEVERIVEPIVTSGDLCFLDPTPLAAASVGQVHGAKLADGREVVIKVRRPGLRKQVSTDLEILLALAELVEKHLPALASARPAALVEEFGRGLTAELDFSLEAVNLERFGRFYASNPKVKVPRIYRSLCSERVLVMEKVDGLKFNDSQALKAAGYDLPSLARFGAEVVFEQIMVFGYFHGDPHPGNLLVQPGPRAALVDFGLVGRLSRQTRDILLDLTLAAVRKKPRNVTSALLKLVKADGDSPPDRERLEVEVDLFLEANLGRPLKELNIGKILNDLLNVAAQYRLSLPPDLLLLVKSLTQLEGLGLQLDPDFDLVKVARPFIINQYRRRYNPRYWFRRFGEELMDFKDFLEMLPNDLKPFYNMLRSGRLKSEFIVEGLEGLRQTVDRSSYRLSFAIVLASLVIGSSVVIHADIPPKWNGLPVLGLVGFLGAALVGFWLLYDFLRNKRF